MYIHVRTQVSLISTSCRSAEACEVIKINVYPISLHADACSSPEHDHDGDMSCLTLTAQKNCTKNHNTLKTPQIMLDFYSGY